MYTRRLETGDANALEPNQINLELLNVRTEARMNQTALNNKLKELLVLNGNQPLTDLSRLGRDMTESSYYAERFFPEHGIHYLAPGNDFDSMGDNMMAPFQFAMTDVYLRDTSRKAVSYTHLDV